MGRPEPNYPRPRSPLATKGHFNSQRSKGRLGATEAAGKCSGRFRPSCANSRYVVACPIGTDTQKV
jgi:hypothetical protein